MTKEFKPEHLHIAAFAQSGGSFAGEERLARFDRLIEETQGVGGENWVTYTAKGEMRTDAAGVNEVWLHLTAQVTLPLVCQRCLGPVDQDVMFDRYFRFVASEDLAAIEDEESEEDVLVLSRDFNLLDLLEDELLMAMPPAPTHEVCPVSIKFQAVDSDFEAQTAQKPNPFAVLAALKKNGGS
jgi:uncharacterized protein